MNAIDTNNLRLALDLFANHNPRVVSDFSGAIRIALDAKSVAEDEMVYDTYCKLNRAVIESDEVFMRIKGFRPVHFLRSENRAELAIILTEKDS